MFLKAISIKSRAIWPAWIIMVLAILLPMKANADIQLKFGVYTSDKPSEMVKSFRPILNAIESGLTNRLGEPVKISMQVANSYEKGVDDLVSGAVDFARFGPASYITARECNPDIKILAIESKKGRKEFNGVTCVAEDGPLQGMEDLQAVLLEMDAPDALKALKKDGFLAGADADYAVIRTAMQQNPRFFE